MASNTANLPSTTSGPSSLPKEPEMSPAVKSEKTPDGRDVHAVVNPPAPAGPEKDGPVANTQEAGGVMKTEKGNTPGGGTTTPQPTLKQPEPDRSKMVDPNKPQDSDFTNQSARVGMFNLDGVDGYRSVKIQSETDIDPKTLQHRVYKDKFKLTFFDGNTPQEMTVNQNDLRKMKDCLEGLLSTK